MGISQLQALTIKSGEKITSSKNANSAINGDFSVEIKAPKISGYREHDWNSGVPKKSYSFQVIEDGNGARAGSKYQRFEVRDGDCFPGKKKGDWNDCENDRERFEFTSKPSQQPEGKQCYGYSLRLSEDFQTSHPTNTDLGQVHQRGGPTGTAGGYQSFPPLIQIGATKHFLMFGWHELTGDENNITDKKRQHSLIKLSKMKGVWTDISFCLDYDNKRMDAWVNGEHKVKINKSPINFKPKSTYFKYGIYRSFVSRYKSISEDGKMPSQVVYYDEVRRGNSIEEVDVNINPNLKPVD